MPWKESGMTLSVGFQCPWTPPVGVVKHLSLRYPDACFIVKFDDFPNFFGWAVYAHGEEIHGQYHEYDYAAVMEEMGQKPIR
jgi:hypothetical protein